MKKHHKLNKKNIKEGFIKGMKAITKSFALKVFWAFCDFVVALF